MNRKYRDLSASAPCAICVESVGPVPAAAATSRRKMAAAAAEAALAEANGMQPPASVAHAAAMLDGHDEQTRECLLTNGGRPLEAPIDSVAER